MDAGGGTGDGGGLMLAGKRQGHRFVATGFNPFPYLGSAESADVDPTLNMLGYLAGFGAQTAGFRTGEPWIVPAGVKTIILPSGATKRSQPGTFFTATDAQGIYNSIAWRAAGRCARSTSPIWRPRISRMSRRSRSNHPRPVARAPRRSVRTPLTPYVLAAIIALIVLEALLVYRAAAWRSKLQS